LVDNPILGESKREEKATDRIKALEKGNFLLSMHGGSSFHLVPRKKSPLSQSHQTHPESPKRANGYYEL